MNAHPLFDGLLQGVVTVLALVGFIAVCIHAYAPWNRRTFDEAARAPLDESAPADTEKTP